MGLFVYAVMGGVKEASVGPTAVLSLMTLRFVSQGGPLLAVLLAFLTGLIELLVGLLNLGSCLSVQAYVIPFVIFFSLFI